MNTQRDQLFKKMECDKPQVEKLRNKKYTAGIIPDDEGIEMTKHLESLGWKKKLPELPETEFLGKLKTKS